MRDSIVQPISFIIQTEHKKGNLSSYQLNVDKKNFTTIEDYIHYLTHHVNNKKHKDGRVYFNMVDEVLSANSVSPYAEKFWDNIEPKIKPLINILKSKRYLTYSSCEGHGLDFRRYVGIAFSDEVSRKYVADYINSFKIRGVKLIFLDSVVNNIITEHDKTGKPYPVKSTELNVDFLNKKIDEVKNFNIQFHRSYEEYFFLELVIFEEILHKYEGIWKEIKKIYLKWEKRKYLEASTDKLVLKLTVEEFKKYNY